MHPPFACLLSAPATRAGTCTIDYTYTIAYSGGQFFTIMHSIIDPYPPQNHADAFVQAVRDRRVELYSDMGWPDPNPPAIPPLNR